MWLAARVRALTLANPALQPRSCLEATWPRGLPGTTVRTRCSRVPRVPPCVLVYSFLPGVSFFSVAGDEYRPGSSWFILLPGVATVCAVRAFLRAEKSG